MLDDIVKYLTLDRVFWKNNIKNLHGIMIKLFMIHLSLFVLFKNFNK